MNYLNFLVVTLLAIVLIRIIEVFLFDKNREQGKVYAWWTLGALTINYGLMVLSSIVEYIIARRQINFIISGIAIIIMIVRFVIKYWAFKSLGKYYSSNIEIRESHKLVKTGPYKYLRHPVYLTTLLDYIAIPLFLNSFYTIFWSFSLEILIIRTRICFEEKALISKFGDEYIKYKNEAGGLIPSFYVQERRK